ncbi:nitrite reductase small subunit NirD [Kribbella sp. NPDC051770]|uniref:nitrite reductase small subunit NirD n=1 Tax=Kribbella sp. NPDC051770 TaxID=3155413 RepID=UPI00341AB6EF
MMMVCSYDELLPERGVAALLDGRQIALFRTHTGEVFALGNQDPFSGANVLSRGIVGSRGEVPTVASPMFKQVFDLRTGVCLDDPGVGVTAYAVEVRDGLVLVGAAEAGREAPGLDAVGLDAVGLDGLGEAGAGAEPAVDAAPAAGGAR